MATQKLNLTRDQLATFLGNHELIKQFERLSQIADEVAPSSDTTGISIQAGNADAAANEALAQIVRIAQDAATNSGAADQKAVQALDALGRIANALEMLATGPVIQNNNSVVTDYIDLPEDGPHVTQPRRVQWNRDDGTMDVGLYGGSVLQVGQELHYYAKNTSGGLIANGTPVMFTGTIGASGKLTFGLAVADGSVPAEYMMGVATQDIADNAFGYVTSFGLVRGFNTTGAPYGEVWADGDLLYFDPATPGTWTNVQPQAPNIDVPVAVVTNAGTGGSGSIFVRMTVAESLSRLQDVYINGTGTPANGDVLVYDLADSRWENKTQSTLSVGSSTNLNGGAVGSVPYQTAPGTTTFRAIGTAGQVFRVNGGATAPEWVSPAALTKVDDTNVTLTLGGNPTIALLASASLSLGWTGQLAVSRGGTGASSLPADGILYGRGTLPVGSVAAGGTGDVLLGNTGSAPSWGKVGLSTHVSGTLGTLNGGTGLTSYTANRIVYASTTTTLATSNNLQFDGTNFAVPSGNGSFGASSGPAQVNAVSTSNTKTALQARSSASGDVGQRAIVVEKFDNNSTTSQVFVQFTINNTATANGQINANGASQVAFGSWSDCRLKENIKDLPSQLNNIMALRPVEFDYIASEGGGHQIGFVAQEMQEVYADAVGERAVDGMLTITGWGKTEARLVKSIQELCGIVESLQREIILLKEKSK